MVDLDDIRRRNPEAIRYYTAIIPERGANQSRHEPRNHAKQDPVARVPDPQRVVFASGDQRISNRRSKLLKLSCGCGQTE